jgi:ATP-binding cassette subfamily B protein
MNFNPRDTLMQLSYLPQAIRLVWQAARGWTLVWLVLLTAQGLLPAMQVWLTRALVDGLVPAFGAGHDWQRVRPVLWLAGLMFLLMLLAEALRGVTSYVRTAQAELLKDHITSLIQQQSVAADFAFYENADFYDHLHRARDEAGYRPVLLIDNLGSLLQNSITLLAIMLVLLPFGWWLPLVLLIGTLPALLVVLRYTLRQHNWNKRVTTDRRRLWYYDWLLTSDETAAEIRLFDLGRYFQSLRQTLAARLRREQLQMAATRSLAEFGAGALALLVTGATLGWMAWQTFQGTITLGVLALFYQAFNQGQQLLRSLLGNVGQMYANSLFLGNLFEFLALHPTITDPAEPVAVPRPLRKGIQFNDVTFRYPGNERAALQSFNLTVPAGQIAAIVGLNGAGKTTLIKLLCRLYDPLSGTVYLDDTDLRRVSVSELRRAITVLFQHPAHYNTSVADNIRFGDVEAATDQEKIIEAARAAGVEDIIARLPNGYDCLLGKHFAEGTELSTGEWQRLALARAFLRRSDIMLLDEPTSAMDSWAEADWLHRFRQLAAGRTVIIITHRFTTAMRADLIHVMDQGCIVESGTHNELLARDGVYAQSWKTQMEEIAHEVATHN